MEFLTFFLIKIKLLQIDWIIKLNRFGYWYLREKKKGEVNGELNTTKM